MIQLHFVPKICYMLVHVIHTGGSIMYMYMYVYRYIYLYEN